jgi:hypothetical protein
MYTEFFFLQIAIQTLFSFVKVQINNAVILRTIQLKLLINNYNQIEGQIFIFNWSLHSRMLDDIHQDVETSAQISFMLNIYSLCITAYVSKSQHCTRRQILYQFSLYNFSEQ